MVSQRQRRRPGRLVARARVGRQPPTGVSDYGVAAGPALGKAVEWSGMRAVPLLLDAVSALCLAATHWPARATCTPAAR